MYKILGGDGKEYGPVTVETLRQWMVEGRANAQTQVLPEGAAAWVPLGSLPEFAAGPAPAAAPAPIYMPGGTAPAGGRAAALALATPAGWALTIVGILGVLMCIGMILFSMVNGVEANPMFQRLMSHQPVSDAMRVGQKVGVFATLILGIGWAGFIAFAGQKLRRLESWGLVLTAGILCVLPCCGTQFPLCFLSAPVGIWVIVVLCLGKVKSAFT
jgi:hypothetical protein